MVWLEGLAWLAHSNAEKLHSQCLYLEPRRRKIGHMQNGVNWKAHELSANGGVKDFVAATNSSLDPHSLRPASQENL